MAKKEQKNKKKNVLSKHSGKEEKDIVLTMKDETKHGILAIAFWVLSAFLVLSYYNTAGIAGDFTYGLLGNLFGTGYFLFPIMSFLLGMSFMKAVKPKLVSVTLGGGILFLISTLALTDIIFRQRTFGDITGGSIGYLVSVPFLKLFESTLSIIALGAIATISTLIIFESRISLEPYLFGKRLWGKDESLSDDEEEDDNEDIEEAVSNTKITEDIDAKKKEESKAQTKPTEDKNKKIKISDKVDDFIASGIAIIRSKNQVFVPPPLSIFEKDSGKPNVGDIKANANVIKRTLGTFGIDVEMDEISIGPSVTRYAMKPAEGIKISRIVTLQDNLSLALAAHPLRIEAPIPGKSLVGIEIPNKLKSIVGMGSLFNTQSFQESPHALYLALGRTVSGIPYYSNLSKAPHMLIAGTTGSGKSVTIHAIISSLLYRNPPEKVKFIMIDPKRVELTLYKGIQHLLTGVITDPKKAILALKWAAKEMERRYNILETATAKDIQSYHKMVEESKKNSEEIEDDENSMESMPYIVIVIDELADIMSAYPRELESSIVRLAQMSRAVGIHLILSTQRPSVEIITGLIKANIPSRIALQVPSQIDSRTILDAPGAEKLLGAGDMLYIGGETSKPIRIQSGYITENEIKKLVKFLKERHQDDAPEEINISEVKEGDTMASVDFGGDSGLGGDDDESIFNEAKKVVMSTQKASASLLQRKLKLGYARAARIMDLLEERGVIGPGDGAKPREVYMRQGDNMGGGGAVAALEKEYENAEIAEEEDNEGYDLESTMARAEEASKNEKTEEDEEFVM
ncbi:MAG: Cell division protein FtsK/SpoIIIE [Parcubacteria group bacterium GW2011_GWF2_38_76]|nr:MAG: Cell division protein FtsK/SpoIIIE [Parcubacteria group bacterium GW2011_GWF2_38_76]HBM45883.1 cell division protein FtsK [Patescibacteria group bacterium]